MTLQEYLKEKNTLLEQAGIEDAENEVWICLMSVTDLSRAQIRFSMSEEIEDVLAPATLWKLEDVFVRRADHEPLAYITGKTPFYDLEFSVGPGVLIPRFDTEILVETALKEIGNIVTNIEMSGFSDVVRIFDLCTGSGCVGITIAHELKQQCIPYELVMTEISPEAATYATANAQRILGDGDWRVELADLWPTDASMTAEVTQVDRNEMEPTELPETSKADLIVSNPPYIPEEEMQELAPEVRNCEPSLALTDGGDGLALYRRIAQDIKKYLKPGGVLAVEHGYNQGEAVRGILGQTLTDPRTIQDYGGHDRVTCAKSET